MVVAVDQDPQGARGAASSARHTSLRLKPSLRPLRPKLLRVRRTVTRAPLPPARDGAVERVPGPSRPGWLASLARVALRRPSARLL